MTEEPKTGDVLLLARTGGWLDQPASELIQTLTQSPYSHTILALGDGTYAEANVREGADAKTGADVWCFDEQRIGEILPKVTQIDLFRIRRPVPNPRAMLDRIVDLQQRADPRRPNAVRFSLGDLAALGILTQIQHLPQSDRVARLRRAFLAATGDGDEALFCSSFVHLALDAGGARPALPSKDEVPVIDLRGFPTDEPVEAEALWLDGVGDWLEKRWTALHALLQLADATWSDFQGVWARIKAAYDADAPMPRLLVSDFFTPRDFSRSSSFTHVATRRQGTGWEAPAPPPPYVG